MTIQARRSCRDEWNRLLYYDHIKNKERDTLQDVLSIWLARFISPKKHSAAVLFCRHRSAHPDNTACRLRLLQLLHSCSFSRYRIHHIFNALPVVHHRCLISEGNANVYLNLEEPVNPTGSYQNRIRCIGRVVLKSVAGNTAYLVPFIACPGMVMAVCRV